VQKSRALVAFTVDEVSAVYGIIYNMPLRGPHDVAMEVSGDMGGGEDEDEDETRQMIDRWCSKRHLQGARDIHIRPYNNITKHGTQHQIQTQMKQ
jgi:hypothetical protein